MKVVILAGGYGTRISEESVYKPKPMVEIGGKPILWHIMKEYSCYGYDDFIICAGYKQHVIKEWFSDYFLYNSDVTFDFSNGENRLIVHDSKFESWKVTIIDTGLDTMTGGRIKRIKNYLNDEPFHLTYGDGLCDIDISELYEYHKKMGVIGTVTAVSVTHNKGVLDISGTGMVHAFREKSGEDDSVINGGYMVFEPEIFDYISDDRTVFEKESLVKLAGDNQLCAYIHNGFWQCMDTKREMESLEQMISEGNAPWMKW